MTTITIDRSVVEQALAALEAGTDVDPIFAGETEAALRAALAQQDEPAQESSAYSKDWCLRMAQIEMDAGAEFEIGPDLAQQAEPLNLRDPAVQKRLATQWGYVPAAQAEPVEPVAWIYQNMYTEQEYLVWKKGTGGRNWRPLYAAPPQRKLVPLTEEEIMHIGMTHQSLRQVVRAVERAHGIKE